MTSTASSIHRTAADAPRRHDPSRAAGSRLRVAVSFGVGLAVAALAVVAGARAYAPLLGWDVAAVVLSAWCWRWIAPLAASDTAAHATRDDPGCAVTDVIVLAAAVASLAAVGGVLMRAGSASGGGKDLLAALGLVSILLSWFVVHTLFTLRYARLYYTRPEGGIDFHQAPSPRYLDFAYLAFTIGMTYQVSDTDLQSTEFRSSALRHGLLSFLLGAGTLAAAINFVVGLGG